MQPLASLHTHSWYSLLEGVSAPETLLTRAGTCGYRSLALTDSNNLYGAAAFVEAANAQGVRPLIGACLRQHRTRCVALVADPTGWSNLCRVLSRLHLLEGVLLVDLLRENPGGLHVLADDLVLAERLRDAFGDRLWLEVVRPGRGDRSRQENRLREAELLEGGRRLGLRPVASVAAHFALPEDYRAFRVGTAVRLGTLIDRLPRNLAVAPEHHLADKATFEQRFHDLPEALRNCCELAEQLSDDVFPRKTVLPPARVPRRLGAHRFLRLLCERGLRRRGLYGGPAAHERLGEELVIIEAAGLAPYFLVVRDLARYARRKVLPMALRGSAGNSLVCYLLEITDVDPLRFGLALDRFLHIGRPYLPDIDLDFDWRVRDEAIEYAFRRYGHDHTAMVSSHLFLQPRSAFREAGKIHGLSNEQITELAGEVAEEVDGTDSEAEIEGLADALTPAGFPLEAERWPRVLRDARLLLGRPRHLSVHCGGVVITPRPIDEYVPLQRAAKGVVITHFDKDGVEAAGLVKIDLLGNRALANVAEVLRPIGGGPAAIADDDPAVLALLRSGDMLGVNQLESPAMRHLLIQMQPRGIEDVVCALALIRPGAGAVGMKGKYVRRMHGVESVPEPPPGLGPLLRETYGLPVYQNDALGMIRALTGLSVPESHRLYKRATKKNLTPEEDGRLADEFRRLCEAQGVPAETITEQWVLLTHFRRYSFCKSHAVSYGLLAWQVVAAKAHRPLAFWAAVLNNNQGVYPRRVYVEAIKRAGFRMYLPCVNRSAEAFVAEGDGVRTGLGAVATLPEDVRGRIVVEREKGGPYLDLADFRRRVAPGPEALAALIRCGALDFTGRSRPALFLEAELQGRAPGPAGLYPDAPDPSWTPEDYDAARRRADEQQLLGFVADVPVLSLFRRLLPADAVRSVDLPRLKGQRIRTAGLVAAGRFAYTQKGLEVQFITLEDEWGLMEATAFPGTCRPVRNLRMGPYVVEGKVDEQFGVFGLTTERITLVAPP